MSLGSKHKSDDNVRKTTSVEVLASRLSVLNKTHAPKQLQAYDFLQLYLASPTQIRAWHFKSRDNKFISNKDETLRRRTFNRVFRCPVDYLKRGQVKEPSTYDYKNFKPTKWGLFCTAVFGALKNKQARRSRPGYIPLASPMMHVWFLKNRTCYVSILTNRSRKRLKSLVYAGGFTTHYCEPYEADPVNTKLRPCFKQPGKTEWSRSSITMYKPTKSPYFDTSPSVCFNLIDLQYGHITDLVQNKNALNQSQRQRYNEPELEFAKACVLNIRDLVSSENKSSRYAEKPPYVDKRLMPNAAMMARLLHRVRLLQKRQRSFAFHAKRTNSLGYIQLAHSAGWGYLNLKRLSIQPPNRFVRPLWSKRSYDFLIPPENLLSEPDQRFDPLHRFLNRLADEPLNRFLNQHMLSYAVKKARAQEHAYALKEEQWDEKGWERSKKKAWKKAEFGGIYSVEPFRYDKYSPVFYQAVPGVVPFQRAIQDAIPHTRCRDPIGGRPWENVYPERGPQSHPNLYVTTIYDPKRAERVMHCFNQMINNAQRLKFVKRLNKPNPNLAYLLADLTHLQDKQAEEQRNQSLETWFPATTEKGASLAYRSAWEMHKRRAHIFSESMGIGYKLSAEKEQQQAKRERKLASLFRIVWQAQKNEQWKAEWQWLKRKKTDLRRTGFKIMYENNWKVGSKNWKARQAKKDDSDYENWKAEEDKKYADWKNNDYENWKAEQPEQPNLQKVKQDRKAKQPENKYESWKARQPEDKYQSWKNWETAEPEDKYQSWKNWETAEPEDKYASWKNWKVGQSRSLRTEKRYGFWDPMDDFKEYWPNVGDTKPDDPTFDILTIKRNGVVYKKPGHGKYPMESSDYYHYYGLVGYGQHHPRALAGSKTSLLDGMPLLKTDTGLTYQCRKRFFCFPLYRREIYGDRPYVRQKRCRVFVKKRKKFGCFVRSSHWKQIYDRANYRDPAQASVLGHDFPQASVLNRELYKQAKHIKKQLVFHSTLFQFDLKPTRFPRLEPFHDDDCHVYNPISGIAPYPLTQAALEPKPVLNNRALNDFYEQRKTSQKQKQRLANHLKQPANAVLAGLEKAYDREEKGKHVFLKLAYQYVKSNPNANRSEHRQVKQRIKRWLKAYWRNQLIHINRQQTGFETFRKKPGAFQKKRGHEALVSLNHSLALNQQVSCHEQTSSSWLQTQQHVMQQKRTHHWPSVWPSVDLRFQHGLRGSDLVLPKEAQEVLYNSTKLHRSVKLLYSNWLQRYAKAGVNYDWWGLFPVPVPFGGKKGKKRKEAHEKKHIGEGKHSGTKKQYTPQNGGVVLAAYGNCAMNARTAWVPVYASLDQYVAANATCRLKYGLQRKIQPYVEMRDHLCIQSAACLATVTVEGKKTLPRLFARKRAKPRIYHTKSYLCVAEGQQKQKIKISSRHYALRSRFEIRKTPHPRSPMASKYYANLTQTRFQSSLNKAHYLALIKSGQGRFISVHGSRNVDQEKSHCVFYFQLASSSSFSSSSFSSSSSSLKTTKKPGDKSEPLAKQHETVIKSQRRFLKSIRNHVVHGDETSLNDVLAYYMRVRKTETRFAFLSFSQATRFKKPQRLFASVFKEEKDCGFETDRLQKQAIKLHCYAHYDAFTKKKKAFSHFTQPNVTNVESRVELGQVLDLDPWQPIWLRKTCAKVYNLADFEAIFAVLTLGIVQSGVNSGRSIKTKRLAKRIKTIRARRLDPATELATLIEVTKSAPAPQTTQKRLAQVSDLIIDSRFDHETKMKKLRALRETRSINNDVSSGISLSEFTIKPKVVKRSLAALPSSSSFLSSSSKKTKKKGAARTPKVTRFLKARLNAIVLKRRHKNYLAADLASRISLETWFDRFQKNFHVEASLGNRYAFAWRAPVPSLTFFLSSFIWVTLDSSNYSKSSEPSDSSETFKCGFLLTRPHLHFYQSHSPTQKQNRQLRYNMLQTHIPNHVKSNSGYITNNYCVLPNLCVFVVLQDHNVFHEFFHPLAPRQDRLNANYLERSLTFLTSVTSTSVIRLQLDHYGRYPAEFRQRVEFMESQIRAIGQRKSKVLKTMFFPKRFPISLAELEVRSLAEAEDFRQESLKTEDPDPDFIKHPSIKEHRKALESLKLVESKKFLAIAENARKERLAARKRINKLKRRIIKKRNAYQVDETERRNKLAIITKRYHKRLALATTEKEKSALMLAQTKRVNVVENMLTKHKKELTVAEETYEVSMLDTKKRNRKIASEGKKARRNRRVRAKQSHENAKEKTLKKYNRKARKYARSFVEPQERFWPDTTEAEMYRDYILNVRYISRQHKLRLKLIRLLKMIRPFIKTQVNPGWMALTLLPVCPPDLRPMVLLDDQQVAVSDLNKFYQEILFRNRRQTRAYQQRAGSAFERKVFGFNAQPNHGPDFYYNRVDHTPNSRFLHRTTQQSIDNLMENGKAGAKPLCASNDRPFKSLSDGLKGKKGRFRLNLLGKRVDYSGRSVIVVGPTLKLHECGLPREMAMVLFQTHLTRKLLNMNPNYSVAYAKYLINKQHPYAMQILEKIVESRPVLLNRAPTLHRLGIQAFKPKLVSGRAILLHPLVCSAFNADFDGDQMAVHIPLSPQSSAEAWALMWSRNHLRSVATGDTLLMPSQDMVLGCYYLTSWDNLARWKQLKQYCVSFDPTFSDLHQVEQSYALQKVSLHTVIWLRTQTAFELLHRQPCFELQIHRSGATTHLYTDYKKHQAKSGQPSVWIKTTVGRVLAHQSFLTSLT